MANGHFVKPVSPDLTPTNENPGALAGASGADLHTIGIVSKAYSKPGASAMSLYCKDAHKRACRMLGYALTLNDPATWHQAAAIFNRRLDRMELASVAFAALSAMEPEDREAVFGAAHWGVA